jgi:hypothetical protein
MRVLGAGALYCALVFALGFVLGALRVLVLVPALGLWGALLLELPVILAASWLVAGRVIRWCGVPPGWAPRMGMGAVAFALLMGAEFALGQLMFGRDLAAHLAQYAAPTAQLGLAGQLAFAAIPLLHRSRPR